MGAVILAAVDGLAQAAGLTPGMRLADARARVPELRAEPHDPAADAALLEWLADSCDRYTPMVMAVPPHGLVLDITGCAHLMGGEAALVDDIISRLARLGLTAWPALAATPDAALALAQHQADSIDDLPVAALALPEASELALRRAGLLTIGRVARQHMPALAARFGEALPHLLARLSGAIAVPVTPRRSPSPVEVERRFAAPLTQVEAALATIEALVVRAGLILTERAEGGRCFAVALFRSDGHVARLSVETAAPVRDPAVLIRLLRERIGALADPIDPGFGFDLIRLMVPVTAPLAAQQLRLEGGSLADSEVGALVDRLGARLGRGRVRRLVAADSHIPEQAAFELPLGDAATSAAWLAAAPGEPPLRPVTLFDPPQIIQVIAEVPDGPPRRFRWRRQTHDVVRHEGPERIAAQWWRRADGAGLTRDYYRVEDTNGRRFWLFRHGLYGSEKPDPDWYLHGLFA
jgi:protein ImuB